MVTEQQFFDRFTRSDELLVQNGKLLQDIKNILSEQAGISPSGSLIEQRRRAENGEYSDYAVRSYSLATARANEPIVVDGDFIHAWTDGNYSNIGIRFNNTNNDLVYFNRRNPIYGFKFWQLFLTNDAQPGRTLDLMIGRNAKVYAESVNLTTLNTDVAAVVYTSATPPAAGTVYTTMVDCRSKKNLLFYVVNTSNVAITVQAIGNVIDATANSVYINGILPVAATTGVISVGINLNGDDWHPYIGLEIVIPAGAAAGNIVITEVPRS